MKGEAALVGRWVGSYRLIEELGSGGMGTVFLAHGDEGCVALKLLHHHLVAQPGAIHRFRREAAMGSRVRHKNVVHAFGSDIATLSGETVYFLVMEYVEGRTLRQLLLDLGTVPEGLLREIALQVSAGLSAVHAAGVVHADLKPENVIITSDELVRIMDLGVARPPGEEGRFMGSIHYAAPEQLRRERVGPTADLYSLGLTLYELSTGHHPFRRDSTEEVIAAQLEETPSPAAFRNPDISLFLSEVMSALMSKSPEERFVSADDLHATLLRGKKAPWWAKREDAILEASGRVPRIPVRRDSALKGREMELAALRAGWELAREGRGNVIIIEGEAGIGKTRLIDAFLRSLEGEDAHLLFGSYASHAKAGGISSAILEHFGSAGLERGLRRALEATPTLVSAYTAAVMRTEPPPGSKPLHKDTIHALTCDLMRHLASEKVVVWVVEDLHNAESGWRQLVLSLARALRGNRVLLVATTRLGLPGAEIEEFGRLEESRTLSLERLSREEVVEVLRDAFKSEVLAEKLGPRIAEKSDGVPYFVFEMIRGLKEGLFVTELPDGTHVETREIDRIEVPSAVRDLVETRLQDVADEDRRLIEVAAVEGFGFDPDLLAKVRGVKRVHVLERLAVVERGTGLVRATGRTCRFDHHLVQEVLHEGLQPTLREEYHTLLADAYAEKERIGEDPSGAAATFLATHHLEGGRPWDGLPFLAPAIGHLALRHRNEAILDLTARALSLPDLLSGEQRLQTMHSRATRLDLLGRSREEERLRRDAVRLADALGPPGPRALAHRLLGLHLGAAGDHEPARAMLLDALELAHRAGDRMEEGSIHGALGNICKHRGQFEDARGHIEQHLEISRDLGDREEEAKARGNLALLFYEHARYESAHEHFERAYEIFREAGLRREEAAVVGNLGALSTQLGRFEEAKEHYERHLSICREIGHRRGEAMAMGNLGMTHRALGRYALAEKHYERYVVMSRETGDRRSEYQALGQLGLIYMSLGDLEKGREYWDACLAIVRELGDSIWEAFALQWIGVIAEQRGDLEGAQRLVRRAIETWREIRLESTIPEGRVNLARILRALGREEEAHRELEEALKSARELDLATPIFRAEAFLGRHAPEHEEKVDLVDRLEARFVLFEKTGDLEHLSEARRLLMVLKEHAPEEYRSTLIEEVPLYRRLAKAWELRGAR